MSGMRRVEEAIEMAEKGHSLEEIATHFDTTKRVITTSIWREMKKTNRRQVRLFLTDKSYDSLKQEADERGLEVAGIVRSLISKHIREQKEKKINEGKG